MNAGALAWFARSVERAYGPITALWYVVLQGSQFHLWYYASRTLPNMFAFFLSTSLPGRSACIVLTMSGTLALAFLLPNPTSSLGPVKRHRVGLYLLTIATVIFRSELALLLGAHCLWMLLKPQTMAAKIALIRTTLLPAVIPGALVALLLTVTIDSYFWQSETYLWPELSAFLSNIFPEKGSQGASAWGTQPFHWYFTAAIPRLLMSQVLLIDFFGLLSSTRTDGRILDNQFPSIVYIVLYSFLPHKETRFLFPIVPSLTLLAALRCTHLTINAHKNVATKLLLYAAIASTITTAFLSHAILLPLSAQNYPGGQALQELHEYYRHNWPYHIPEYAHYAVEPQIRVHLTNLALQSGVTRFLEEPQTLDPAISETHRYASTKLVQTDDKYANAREPLILPGSPDGDRPALTIYPKSPAPSVSIPTSNFREKYQYSTWIYDKTSNSTGFLEPEFWNQFDFVIVENPAHVIGAWEIIEEVKALGRPRIMKPDGRRRTLTAPASQTAELDQAQEGTAALLHAMYPISISQPLITLHNIAHDLLRESGFTRGYWLEVPLVTKLYILKRSISGISPNSVHESPPEPTNAVEPNRYDDNNHDVKYIESQAGNSDQHILDMEELGPLVVNKDGTLSRLDNWAQMTPQEKKRTVEYLKKRNMIRMEGVAK